MKVRNGFVSNSSSSSFMITYDKNKYNTVEDVINEIASRWNVYSSVTDEKFKELLNACTEGRFHSYEDYDQHIFNQFREEVNSWYKDGKLKPYRPYNTYSDSVAMTFIMDKFHEDFYKLFQVFPDKVYQMFRSLNWFEADDSYDHWDDFTEDLKNNKGKIILNFADGGESFHTNNGKLNDIERALRYDADTFDHDSIKVEDCT